MRLELRLVALVLLALSMLQSHRHAEAAASTGTGLGGGQKVEEGGGLIVGSIETERILVNDIELPYEARVVFGREGFFGGAVARVLSDNRSRNAKADVTTPERRVWMFWIEVPPGSWRVERLTRAWDDGSHVASPKRPRPFEVRAGQATYVGRFFITGHIHPCVRQVNTSDAPIRFFEPCVTDIHAENSDKFKEDKALADTVLPHALRAVAWPETALEPAFDTQERPNYAFMLERALAAQPDVRRARPTQAELEATYKALHKKVDMSRE